MNFQVENPMHGALFVTAVLFLFASLGGCQPSGTVEIDTADGVQRQEAQRMWEEL